MIDAIDNKAMSMYNTATYDVAKERADANLFEETLKAAQNASDPRKTGLTKGKLTLTEEQQLELQDKKLKEACQGFEAMFMELMYKKMRDTVPEDSLFGNSNANKIWQSMLDSELMQQGAKAGGMGLADMLYKQLKPQVMAQATIEKNA